MTEFCNHFQVFEKQNNRERANAFSFASNILIRVTSSVGQHYNTTDI